MAAETLKQQTKNGLIWNMIGQISNYGLAFVIGVILARKLMPSDYGLVAMPMVFLAIAQCFVDSGFGSALVRKEKLTEEDLSTAFYFSIIVGLVAYAILFFSSPWIAEFYNAPLLEELLKFSALSVIFSPLTSVQSVQLTRKLDFKTLTKLSVISHFTTGAIGIVMAYAGFGVWSLVIPGIFTNIQKVCLLYYFVRWLPKTGWSMESFRYLWGYGNKMLASGLLDRIYSNLYPIIIGKFFSAAQLGLYTRAKGYAELPSQNVTSTIQSVTFPVLSKLQNDNEALARNYRKMLCTSAYVIFPIMVMLSALAYPFIVILITEKWVSCVVLLQIICFSQMWYPIHAINLNLLMVKGRSDLFFRLEIIKKIIGVSIMCVTVPLGIEAMCYGGIVSSILCLGVNTYYTGKLINVGFVRQMQDLAPILILSLFTFGCTLAFVHATDNLYLQLFGGGIIGVCIYLGGSFIFKLSELEYVKYMLSRNKH